MCRSIRNFTELKGSFVLENLLLRLKSRADIRDLFFDDFRVGLRFRASSDGGYFEDTDSGLQIAVQELWVDLIRTLCQFIEDSDRTRPLTIRLNTDESFSIGFDVSAKDWFYQTYRHLR